MISIWEICNEEQSSWKMNARSVSSPELRDTKSSPYYFDQPNKYVDILRAKLNYSDKPASAPSASAEKAGTKFSRISVFQILRQFSSSVESQSPLTFGNILTQEQFKAVWTFLPSRYQIGAAKTIFNSSVDGISIQTFLNRLKDAPATLIVIKTTKNEIFGAFCSENWSNRFENRTELTFFGTGESFLFSCLPRNAIYPWVGLTTHAASESPRTPSFFQAANAYSIVIGGGDGSGIGFISDLSRGFTGSCTTFANPPLCSSGEFYTSMIEVYGLWL